MCLEEFTIFISREKFEPEPGFDPRISRSLAWRSYQSSYPSSHSYSCSNVPLEMINAKRFLFLRVSI